MNCYYCQKLCRRFTPDGKQVDYTTYWQCDYHGSVTIRHYPKIPSHADILYSHSLVLYYKDSKYQAIFFHDDNSIYKFRIDKLNPYPRTVQMVMTLDFHPDLTPENVQDKIKTYLLFS